MMKQTEFPFQKRGSLCLKDYNYWPLRVAYVGRNGWANSLPGECCIQILEDPLIAWQGMYVNDHWIKGYIAVANEADILWDK